MVVCSFLNQNQELAAPMMQQSMMYLVSDVTTSHNATRTGSCGWGCTGQSHARDAPSTSDACTGTGWPLEKTWSGPTGWTEKLATASRRARNSVLGYGWMAAGGGVSTVGPGCTMCARQVSVCMGDCNYVSKTGQCVYGDCDYVSKTGQCVYGDCNYVSKTGQCVDGDCNYVSKTDQCVDGDCTYVSKTGQCVYRDCNYVSNTTQCLWGT